MIKVVDTEKIPIKLWLNEMEEGALDQAKNLANLPFAYKHIAIMPDSHLGYGMPIGGVMPTKGVIVPNAVGVDIGCGVSFSKSFFKEESLTENQLKRVMGKIREEIPVGFNHRDRVVNNYSLNELIQRIDTDYHPVISSQDWKALLKQAGTLGGGNHFIEIQTNQDGYLFVMVHSGSRNIGKKVADAYNKIAKKLNDRWFSCVPSSQNLAFLPVESLEAHQYMDEMKWCVDFARENRRFMINTIRAIMSNKLSIPLEESIDVAHNYARFENHFGENVIVHRKGATSAKNGEIVIIPGSQGTKSYIGVGLGNKESFNSCSHGAGRKMSRSKAKKELNLEHEIKLMEDQGIIHGMRNKGDLDEASSAYKDIDKVMKNQSDLVHVKHTLTPKAVIKG
jgi:tRNA-splicing ligase RtcB